MGGIDQRIAGAEFWSSIGYWILVAGLVGDILVLVIPRHRERLEKVLAGIFTIVIIVGVAIEHREDKIISVLVSQGQATTGLQIAQLEKEAGVAREMAERERLERIKLEAIVAPRSLSLEQQRLIASACSRFHGRGVLVSSYGMDGEGAALGGQIISVLRSAGITVADARASIVVTGGFEMGVHVRGPDVERDLVSCLGNALSSIGKLKVTLNDLPPRFGGGMGGGGQSFPAGTVFVTVMIGIKPVPILATK